MFYRAVGVFPTSVDESLFLFHFFTNYIVMGSQLGYIFCANLRNGTKSWPQGYKTFFMLNLVEHEILNAHKFKNIKEFGLFNAQLSLECYFSR